MWGVFSKIRTLILLDILTGNNKLVPDKIQWPDFIRYFKLENLQQCFEINADER
jgi:hypothetical protein